MKNARSLLRNVSTVAVVFVASISWAASPDNQSDIAKRLSASGKVLDEVMSSHDSAIPDGVIKRARCVAVFPATVQVAVLVGGKRGKGFVSCRTSNGWSAPAPLTVTGGSWGAQLGGEEVDLVVVVTDDKGMQQLESGKLKFGTETSVTAGPVGKHELKMNADILTYSRSRGVFAGMNMDGSSITQDQDDTRALYGKPLSLGDILSTKTQDPDVAQPFVSKVANYAGETRARD